MIIGFYQLRYRMNWHSILLLPNVKNNLTSHLERVRTTKAKEDQAERPKFIKFSEKNTVNQSESSLRSMLTDEHGGMFTVIFFGLPLTMHSI